MPFSVNRLSNVTGFSRQAIQRRVDLFGADPKKILQLAPLSEEHSQRLSLEEARTELAIEDTNLKRITREKLEGKLADADAMIEKVTELGTAVESIIRGSDLEEERKGDIYAAIYAAAKDWAK